MKREAGLLKQKAVDALIVAVEHFNRPWDQGRVCATLILLDHGFEMLLKAAIVKRGGRIRDPAAPNTIGFEASVKQGLSNGAIKFLHDDQALALRTFNNLRDAAQHHLVEVSEEHLYVQTQAGVTLFGDILQDVFGISLRTVLPSRVLPISTRAPNDIPIMLSDDMEEIRRLLKPGRRQRLQARAKVRMLALMENAINDVSSQPSDSELDELLKRIAGGDEPHVIFPGVAALRLSVTGEGIDFSIRISKSQGLPVKLVKVGTADATDAAVVAVHKVNELSYYSLNRDHVAKQLGLTGPKTTALIRSISLQDDGECFKEFQMSKSSRFARYSPKAVDRLRDELQRVNMDEVWREYGLKKTSG